MYYIIHFNKLVLILIVLDLFLTIYFPQEQKCLNPYCIGSVIERSAKTALLFVGKKSLNPYCNGSVSKS